MPSDPELVVGMLEGRASPATESSAIETRLRKAAETGEVLEVIVVLRGRVRPASGNHGGRWRIRVDGQRLSFPAKAVVAVTPVSKRPARREE